MKRTYDLAISLGGSCGMSQALRRAKCQFASFPFDWVGKSSYRKRIELIDNDFADYLVDEDLPHFDKIPKNGKIEHHYYDRFGFIYAHDFDQEKPIPPQIPVVRAKYLRRLHHMSELIVRARRVLVVWADMVGSSPIVSDEDIAFAREVFSRKWPHAEFDLVIFHYDENVPYEKRKTEIRENVTIVTFNIRDPQPGTFMLNPKLLQRWFRSNIRVADYRTSDERRAWNSKERQKKYARYGAKNYLEMVVNRWQIKVYQHLAKRLARKGIV